MNDAALEEIKQRYRGARFRTRLLREWRIRNRHKTLTPEDVLIASYPRSGVTWTRFLLYGVMKGELADFSVIPSVVPYIGKHDVAEPSLERSGRLVYSHEPIKDKVEKVVYIVRDPRAVVVSEYRWQQRKRVNPGPFDRFVHRFVEGKTNPWGSWSSHLDTWLSPEPVDGGKLHLIRYEELRNDTVGTLGEIVRFVGLDDDREVLERAVQDASIENMRAKEDERPHGKTRKDIRFVNSGELAGWRETLSDDQVKLIETSFGDWMKRLGYVSAPPSEVT
jgi:Sulfotransferase domain